MFSMRARGNRLLPYLEDHQSTEAVSDKHQRSIPDLLSNAHSATTRHDDKIKRTSLCLFSATRRRIATVDTFCRMASLPNHCDSCNISLSVPAAPPMAACLAPTAS